MQPGKYNNRVHTLYHLSVDLDNGEEEGREGEIGRVAR